YRDLARLGLHLPFFMVHDIGLLLAAPRDQLLIGARPAMSSVGTRSQVLLDLHRTYSDLVDEVSQSEASNRARTMRLSDDLIVVILARVLGVVHERAKVVAPSQAVIPLEPELVRDLEPQLLSLFLAVNRNFETGMLETLARARLHVLTLADALDLDTLRLLGMLGPESSASGALAHVDLLAALSSPAANDIVNFSLELLPSVLETRRTKSTGTHASHGYAGVGPTGSLDSMVLTELAWDDEELGRRIIDNEIL